MFDGAYGPHGLLWVINTVRAEREAGASAVLAKVSVGCQPVGVQAAPDGRVVWVTALQSNALLGYDAASLLSRPFSALRTVVPVGSEPVGLSLVDNDHIALVANSNRGLVPASTGSDGPQVIDVVDTAAALAHHPALIGSIAAGLFPRDLSFDPATGQVLVANLNSATVEVFNPPLNVR